MQFTGASVNFPLGIIKCKARIVPHPGIPGLGRLRRKSMQYACIYWKCVCSKEPPLPYLFACNRFIWKRNCLAPFLFLERKKTVELSLRTYHLKLNIRTLHQLPLPTYICYGGELRSRQKRIICSAVDYVRTGYKWKQIHKCVYKRNRATRLYFSCAV